MRTDYIDFPTMFFGQAFLAAMRSKDPSTQCGACLVKDNRQIGIGYNGMISGIQDSTENWGKEEKKKFIYHAEENAVRNSKSTDLTDSSIFLWTSNPMIYLPCDRCARTLAHYGVKQIHVLSGEEIERLALSDTRWNVGVTVEIFNMVGIKVVSYDRKGINGILKKIAMEKLRDI